MPRRYSSPSCAVMTTVTVHIINVGSWYLLPTVDRPSHAQVVGRLRDMNSKKDLGPLRVVSALSLGDPHHDKQLTVHVGRHADIIKGMITHWVDTNYFNDLVSLITGGLKEALRSEKSCLILCFYCKSGKHRSVAAAEITAVLLMHLPQVKLLIDHLSSVEWLTTPGCKGARQACRRRPLDNPERTAKLQEALTAFERVGTHTNHKGEDNKRKAEHDPTLDTRL